MRGPWYLIAQVIAGALAIATLFIHLFILEPEVPRPWATASDLEPVPAAGERLLIVLVDGMNPDRALDPTQMPFVAGHLDEAAWGYARPILPTLTGSAVTTLGTGKWTTLIDVIYNFSSPRARADNLFRRLDKAGIRAAFFGDNAWAQRFDEWADDVATFGDRGTHDIYDTDRKTLVAFHAWLDEGAPHRVAVLHLVGADHAGHSYDTRGDGPYAKRLREIDADIARIVPRLPEGTSVLVISDHGMTPGGGHGGGFEGTRDAPFVWWGPGVAPTHKKIILEQAAVAPTLAGYLGVPPPAESAAPPATELLTLTSADAAALHRNARRQRLAVTTHEDGTPMATEIEGRWLGWLLFIALGPLFLLGIFARVAAPDALRPKHPLLPFAPLTALLIAPWLSPLWIGVVAVSAVGASLALCRVDWRAVLNARGHLWIALLMCVPGAFLSVLRWWTWHIPFYMTLAMGILIALAIAAPTLRKRTGLHVALLCGAALLYVLFRAKSDAYLHRLPDGAWGYAAVALIGALTLRPARGWRALRETLGEPTGVGVFAATSLLIVGAMIQRAAPQGGLAQAILLLALGLVIAIARWGAAVQLVGALLLGSALIFNDAQLCILAVITTQALALSSLPAPEKLDARVALVPLLLTLLEASGYLAMGKEYSFSSVQVALAFTGDAELGLFRAVFFVALGDALPWAIMLICAGMWARRSPDSRVLEATLTLAVATLALRLWMVAVAFPIIARSFWWTSSTLPFQGENLVLITFLPAAMAAAIAATRARV